MEKKFIAYFDFLGFKDFIERNDIKTQKIGINKIYLEIEEALSEGKFKITSNGALPDISKSDINCINFSDTVIFWTNTTSVEELDNLLKVSHRFNAHCNLFTFPVRGALVYGNAYDYIHNYLNNKKKVYNVNSIFGNAIILAHNKAENQDWAGTVIDNSVIEYLEDAKLNENKMLLKYAKKHYVPYKIKPENQIEEWIFNFVKNGQKINKEIYNRIEERLLNNFSNYQKRVSSNSVKTKINNTVLFLKTYKI